MKRYLAFFLAMFLLISPVISNAATELDRIVAVVNDDVILQSELNEMLRTIRLQLEKQGTRIPDENAFEQQVLEKLVIEKLQVQIAEANGIRVDDETVNQAIANIAADSNFTLPEFRNVLEKDGYNFASFRENIRQQIMISRLRQRQVDSRIKVSQEEVDQFLENRENQGGNQPQYHLAHILIALPEAASPEAIAKAEKKAQSVLTKLRAGADFRETAVAVSDGQQALEGGDLGWRLESQIPTLFSKVVTSLDVGQVSDLVRSPSGFHIIKLVEKRGGEQRYIVKQTLARHILISTNELISEDDARRRLYTLKERIENGEDFGKLARSHSQDTVSAAEGGNLGWVNPGTMVPEFEKQMNRLAEGQISEPFKTQYGWHIVQVLKRRQHDSSEEYTRAQAQEAIRKRKAEEELQLWLRRVRDEAYVEYRRD